MAAVCPTCRNPTGKNPLLHNLRCPHLICLSNRDLFEKLMACAPRDFPRLYAEIIREING